MYISYVTSFKTEPEENICSYSKTCTECTNNSLCNWSLEKQSCADTKQKLGYLNVHNKTHCPIFSVVNNTARVNTRYDFKVKISNDVNGFIPFLQKTTIKCCYENQRSVSGIINNNTIICNSGKFIKKKSSISSNINIYYCEIIINSNIRLRFDNIYDHYVIIYDRDCEKLENNDCVTCLWSSRNYNYFLKKCSRKNNCTGLRQTFKKNYDIDITEKSLVEDSVELNCPDVTIQSIQPLFAPWTGGININISIKNNWIMMENTTVMVTAAGRNCTNPTTIDEQTIRCTIPLVNRTELSEGPVVVIYMSSPHFKLVSNEIFKFVNPEITGFQPNCGPLNNRTKLIVRGQFLNVSDTIRVSISENLTCGIIESDQNSLSCLTEPSAVATTGNVKLEFNKYLTKYITSPLFTYYNDPFLDEGQLFEGIVSGGTTIPVLGRNFFCVEKAWLSVHSNETEYISNCQVKNDSYIECRSPKIISSVESSTVLEISFHFIYVNEVKHFLKPDNISYVLYSNPTFNDFEIDNNLVIINGHGLARGYRIDDLAVRIPNSTDECVVTLLSEHRIKCHTISSIVTLDNLKVITISIGDGFIYSIIKRTSSYNSANFMVSYLSLHVVIILLFVLLSVGFVLIYFISKKLRTKMTCSSVTELSFAPPNNLSITKL